jgi:hypothetical protein
MEGDAEDARYAQTVQDNVAAYRADLEAVAEERRMRISVSKRTWLSEIEAHRQQRAAAKRREYEESLQFRQTTEQALQEARATAEQKAKVQQARRKELDELNAEQRAHRKARSDAERELDRAMSERAAEGLRREQEDQMVERLARTRKRDHNQSLLAAQLGRVQASNDEAGAYLKRAADEAGQREDDRRARVASARRNLMMDAVADRVATIRLHEEQRAAQREEKRRESEALAADAENKKQLDREELEARRRRIANQYQMLASQCQLRQQIEDRLKQEETQAVTTIIQGWRDEEEKIQQELAHPQALAGGRFRGHR